MRVSVWVCEKGLMLIQTPKAQISTHQAKRSCFPFLPKKEKYESFQILGKSKGM